MRMNWRLEYKNHIIMRQPVGMNGIKKGYLYIVTGRYPANCTSRLKTISQAKEHIDKHIKQNGLE
jgi:hypothetical protein